MYGKNENDLLSLNCQEILIFLYFRDAKVMLKVLGNMAAVTNDPLGQF